ncbi:hypothetical protein EVC37_24065 [Methylocaldum sp. BRCS4]|nr:hypothetical protein [Methylocaldum sp. BRCS4]
MVLDSVFYEAYTRWGGAYTLVVPISSQDFLADGYDEWLQYYDPDFLYTYVDIDQAFVQRIDRLCSPIAFLKHELRNRGDRPIEWRAYIPNWDHYIQPVSSITTIPSPATFPAFLPAFEREREMFVLTQSGLEPPNRFLADNFGTSFSLRRVTHGIPGFFGTLCLTQPDLPPNIHAGTERCTSLRDALAALIDRTAVPIARFAMAHSEAIPRTDPPNWAYAFRLFIGKTVIDRVHSWNCRHLTSSEIAPINSLIVDPAFFDDEALVKQVGQYLNRTNFLGHGSGPYQVELHSASESAETLISIRDKLAAHTWNIVRVSRRAEAAPIPSKKDLEHRIYNRFTDTTTLKLTEDASKIAAKEPSHFVYIPPRLKEIAEGQWIVELSIQRDNNLSKYSNVVDRWVLPRHRKITKAFTQELAKPTRDGTLAVLPTTEGFRISRQGVNAPYSYELHLPDDETFFRHLVLEFFQYGRDDLRASIPRLAYVDLAISDKGQNLRGVISMLDHLSTAYGLFTNKYWRTVLNQAKEDRTRPLTFERSKLESFLPNDLVSAQKLANDLRLRNPGVAKTYLRNNLADTLEHLVRTNVFYQVANWRCRYCGHANSRSFDNMRIRNECDICHTEYLAPLDIEWKYELNDFVYRSLIKHSGLPVLWTLGFLQDQHHMESYWYLPEVDLYEREDNPELKNEIDILCMLGGKFYAVEAKATASMVLNKTGSIEKFLKVIGMLRPDVAMLSFERYGNEDDDIPNIKARLQEAEQFISERLAPGTTLTILVAEDINDFNEFPHNLGWYGRRTRESGA